jgi:branched-chain amino acid transport system permease protein
MADISFGLIALQVLTGLALGCIFVLVATGLTLIFGMLNVVNFAHGAFYAAGPMRGVIPEMGVTVLIEAFVITVIGGMGSLPGAIIAGLLMGVVVSITSYFAADFSNIVMFAIMAVILIVRPQGLLGRPEAAR